MTNNYIGKPTSRVDGRVKVTGEAKYAAEFNVPNLTYGYVVSSEIAKGKITKIDADDALKFPGVLQVLTNENRPAIAWLDRSYIDEVAVPGSPFRPLNKGVGEIGIVGVEGAIANAIFHATGKSIRDLPITPDKLL